MSLELKTQRQLEDELSKRKRLDPLKHVYKPHAAQLRIHRDRSQITVVLGGNRTGKSFGAMAEALFYCLGRSVYAEVPDPPVIVWYVLPSMSMFRRAVIPIFNQLVPPEELKRYNKQMNVAYFKNGSELHFLSADMRQRRLQGASVDFIVMDEAMRLEVYEELQARVFDRGGRILIVLTPVDEIESNWLWIRDSLYIPWESGERTNIQVLFMPIADEDGNPLVPQYTREDIAKLKALYPDPLVQQARLYGAFVTRSGLVFSRYDSEIHHVKRFDIPDNFTRWITIDPQYHRFAALFFCADEQGVYYVTDEYFSQDEPLAFRAERLKAILGDVDGSSIPCYVDSANPQDIAELNWHFNRIGADIGAVPLPMQKKVDTMVLRVHSLLEPDPNREYHKITGFKDVIGAPRLLFFDDIKSTWKTREREVTKSRLFWEMTRMVWDSSKGKPDKSSAGGGDTSDCLIYGCSIMATGMMMAEDNDWMKGMPTADAVLWKAIERHDARQKKGDVWTSWE